MASGPRPRPLKTAAADPSRRLEKLADPTDPRFRWLGSQCDACGWPDRKSLGHEIPSEVEQVVVIENEPLRLPKGIQSPSVALHRGLGFQLLRRAMGIERLQPNHGVAREIVLDIGAAPVDWDSARQETIGDLFGPIMRHLAVLDRDGIAIRCQPVPLVGERPHAMAKAVHGNERLQSVYKLDSSPMARAHGLGAADDGEVFGLHR